MRRLPILAAITVGFLSAVAVGAQAWLPPKGEAWLSVGYGNVFATQHYLGTAANPGDNVTNDIGHVRALTLYRIDLASGRRERFKELAPPDMTGFLEYYTGPASVRITPDGRYYAYTFFTDQGKLTLTDLGKDWWR